MIAMQYSFVLPADYDMGIVHRRIAERGHRTDGLPGLLFKAYLVAEKNDDAAADNLYAPFYLWQHAEAMHGFLEGPGFASVSQAFGWPTVPTWTAWHAHVSPDVAHARFATRSIHPIAPHTALGALREAEGAMAQAALDAGALAVVVGFEPGRWSLVRFCLWRERPAAVSGVQAYAVGHVSVGEASAAGKVADHGATT